MNKIFKVGDKVVLNREITVMNTWQKVPQGSVGRVKYKTTSKWWYVIYFDLAETSKFSVKVHTDWLDKSSKSS